MSDPALPDVAGDWFAAMRRGDWAAAWQATDRIEHVRRARQQAGACERRPEYLVWDGTPLAGRSVMVRCEHGLGDTLQFMRFLPRLGAGELHFMVQPPLLSLLRDAPGLGTVHDWWSDAPLPPHEVDIEVMELPYALRTTLAELPPPYAHLGARLPAFALPDDGRLRVGLVWAASDWDRSRTVPLPVLAPLLQRQELRFYSLQQGEAAEDPLLRQLPVEPLSPGTREIGRAAAAMQALDLVLCVDAMPAHLAATLGRPTWVMLKHEADWRWMEGRTDSPWYPTVRLFRQRAPGDWAGVVTAVAEALLRRALPARSPA